MTKKTRGRIKQFVPYGLMVIWLRRQYGYIIDEPLFYYKGFFKRLKRIVKFMLPYGISNRFRKLHESELMRADEEECMRSGGVSLTPGIGYDSWYEDNGDYSSFRSDIKTIAFYLPQFHTFRENDEWWGMGFTEWTNTRKSKPRFIGHYQPREPHDDIGYYDLADWRVMKRQAELAKQHGIYGFCFYNYWFSGKRLMEKPLDQFLEHSEIDIKFCMCWANENWTRRWDGESDQVLIKQDYEDDSVQYIADLKKFIDDPRYIRFDGKPVVMIYRPSLLPNASRTFARWREWARANGIGEIEIWIQRGCALVNKSVMVAGADAEVEFPPTGTTELGWVNNPEGLLDLKPGDAQLPTYSSLVANVLNGKATIEGFSHRTYRCATLGWDNSSRRARDFFALYGFSLALYYQWLRYLIADTRRKHGREDRFLFINAWNEWAEGTYLEPDRKFGYAAINVTSRAVFDLPLGAVHGKEWRDVRRRIGLEHVNLANLPEPDKRVNPKIGIHLHVFYPDMLDGIAKYLSNVPLRFDLLVSVPNEITLSENDVRRILGGIRNVADIKIKRTTNRGRDIAPLICTFGKILKCYDIVAHFHTKKSLHTAEYGDWSTFIFERLLGTQDEVWEIIGLLMSGYRMVAPADYVIDPGESGWASDLLLAQKTLSKAKIDIDLPREFPVIDFPQGSMFWARRDSIEQLLGLPLKYADFPCEPIGQDGSLAHALERLFFIWGLGRGKGVVKVYKDGDSYSRIANGMLSRMPDMLCLNEWRKKAEGNYQNGKLVSIIVPVYNTDVAMLRVMLDSVQQQTYFNWELCIADASDSEHNDVKLLLAEYARKDHRIRIANLEGNYGISENSNMAFGMVTGDIIALLDHDDVLHPSALYSVMRRFEDESVDFVYTDEAWFQDGGTESVAFLAQKPEFSPHYLRSINYICHFSAFRRSLVAKAGGLFKSAFDGAQDHDLFLRLTDCARKVAHVPEVLYFWRVHKNSTASGIEAKPYAVDAGIRAVQAYVDRHKYAGVARCAYPFLTTVYEVNYEIGIPDLDFVYFTRGGLCDPGRKLLAKMKMIAQQGDVGCVGVFDPSSKCPAASVANGLKVMIDQVDVSGPVVMMRKEIFERFGGTQQDSKFMCCNVAFFNRVWMAGYYNVLIPF